MADRKATNVWSGDLQTGSGETSFDSSGVLPTVPVSFPRRAGDDPEGQTSPEELIAGAHASCFNMGLSSALSKAGHDPERLETSAVVTFSMEGGPHVSRIALRVRGRVAGITADEFQKWADAAKDNCPVSKLVAGNVEIDLDAGLES